MRRGFSAASIRTRLLGLFFDAGTEMLHIAAEATHGSAAGKGEQHSTKGE